VRTVEVIQIETVEIEEVEIEVVENQPEGEAWMWVLEDYPGAFVSDLMMTETGDFYVLVAAEETEDILLFHFDPLGEMLWVQAYPVDGLVATTSLNETADGGLLIGGVFHNGETGLDMYLLHVDRNGGQVWDLIFGGEMDEFGGAQESANGLMLFGNLVDPDDFVTDPGTAGYGGFENRSNMFVAELDLEGNILWSNTIGGDSNVLAVDGDAFPDGGGLILGHRLDYPGSDDDMWLIQIDGTGQEIWRMVWEEGITGARGMVPSADGNYLILARQAPAGDRLEGSDDVLVIKIDREGDIIWEGSYGDPGMVEICNLIGETPEGEIFAIGVQDDGFFSSDENIYYLRLDQDGGLIEELVYEFGRHIIFSDMAASPNGGFFAAGVAHMDQGFVPVLLRLDEVGNLRIDQ
jgi:hypothetical protein